jgi:arylsulfatase A-like enzyme
VGRIVAELDRLGVLDETLVVVTSDHGEEFYEHGGWNHGGSVFEEIVHVPLVVAGGGVPTGGRVLSTPVRHVDLVPTILSFARVAPPEGHGRDLWPAIAGEVPVRPSGGAGAVLVEGCFVRPEGIDGVALYEGGRKLVRIAGADTAATCLYDLERDPLERTDLSVHEATVVESLRAELARWERVARLFDPAEQRVRLDAESVRALRRLGYLQ